MGEYENILTTTFNIETNYYSEIKLEKNTIEADKGLPSAKLNLAFYHGESHQEFQIPPEDNIYDYCKEEADSHSDDKTTDRNIYNIVISDLQANITEKEENYLNILEATDFEIESNLKTVNQLRGNKISLQDQNPDEQQKLSVSSKLQFSLQRQKISYLIGFLTLTVIACSSIALIIWYYLFHKVTLFQPDVDADAVVTSDPQNMSELTYQSTEVLTAVDLTHTVNNINIAMETINVIRNKILTSKSVGASSIMHHLNLYQSDLYSDLLYRRFRIAKSNTNNQFINTIIFNGNEIWTSAMKGIYVYSEDLKSQKMISSNSRMYYKSITLTYIGDVIAVTAHTGLQRFNKTGAYLNKVMDGYFNDVTSYNNSVHVLGRLCQIFLLQYNGSTWNQFRHPINITLSHKAKSLTEKCSMSRLAAWKGTFYISSKSDHHVYFFDYNGIMTGKIGIYGKTLRGGTWNKPIIMGVDESGAMLVVDRGNTRLHVCEADRKCHAVKLKGIGDNPLSAIARKIGGTMNIWVLSRGGLFKLSANSQI